jgi:hypothetical protein
LFDSPAPSDRARERHKAHSGVLHGPRHEVGREVEALHDVGGYPGGVEGTDESFAGEWRLRGGLEEDGVAGDEGGEDGVDGGQVRKARCEIERLLVSLDMEIRG